MTTKEGYQPFSDELSKTPGEIRKVFQAMDRGEGSLDDDFIDEVLGLPALGNVIEGALLEDFAADPYYMNSAFFETPEGTDFVENAYIHTTGGGRERVAYQGSRYDEIREVLRIVNPRQSDVVYDLGCGYGRQSLYGALTTDSMYKGIEIVARRLQAPQKAKDKFSIGNVSFISSDVLQQDISDGTIFYLFNPFSNQTLTTVLSNLFIVAQTKTINVASVAIWDNPSDAPGWLTPIYVNNKNKYRPIQIYKSR